MESFIEKLSQSKAKLFFGLGGAAIIGLFGYLYRKYQNEISQQILPQQEKKQTEPFNLRNELNKFKSTLNLSNPTLDKIKEIISFSFDMTYKEIQRIHNDFKLSRRALKKQGTLKEYFKTVGVGMIRLKQIGTSLQQSLIIDIGLTPQMFAPYQPQLIHFMQEQQSKRAFGNKQVTLGQVKTAITAQVNFLKQHGDQLVSNIILYCKDWQPEAKKFIPDVFTIYLADELAIHYPDMDKYDMRGVQKRFQKYLTSETTMMKQQMLPKVTRLIQELAIYQNIPSQDNEENQNL